MTVKFLEVLQMAESEGLRFNWSEKHKKYMKRTQTCNYNIAEGSIRSGKTTDNVYVFCYWLKRSKDKLHIATASTQATAKLILGDGDGRGIEHIFRGQSRWGKYKGNDALIVKGPATKNQEKIILFVGAGKSDSFKKIRGTTIGLWIATEINLHHETMIREVLKRQVNATPKKLFWDLNPESPGDYIYTEYIDKWQKDANQGIFIGGYNYQQFNIDDNINLSPQNIAEFKSRYTPGTVFYKRDILGLRAVAEGLVYEEYANNEDKFIIDNPENDIILITVGIDYGASKSRSSFKAVGITKNYNNVIVLEEKDMSSTKTPEQVYKEFEVFLRKIKNVYGRVDYAFADWGGLGEIITNGIRNYCAKNNLMVKIQNCKKGVILDRIQLAAQLMAQRRLKVSKNCPNMHKAFLSAVWDKKKEDERLDNGTSDVDSLDAFEYAIYPFKEYLIKRRN